jgi:uncharacterized protein (DUF924 family)
MSEPMASEAAESGWVGEVLRFWFEELGEGDWFAKDHHLDERIRARFLPLYEELAASEARDMRDSQEAATPRALLAAVIVLDQFPRNMFRDSPRAYAADGIARGLARAAVERGLDRSMTDQERNFLYLPFEHSEDRADQALSVELIRRLGNEEWTRYALAHQEMIDRFGRFPHRNAILGRESTPAELARLQEPLGQF